MITPIKKIPTYGLLDWQKEFNAAINRTRAVVEQVIAHLKNWRILHTDYRRPLESFTATISAAIGLLFHSMAWISLKVRKRAVYLLSCISRGGYSTLHRSDSGSVRTVDNSGGHSEFICPSQDRSRVLILCIKDNKFVVADPLTGECCGIFKGL